VLYFIYIIVLQCVVVFIGVIVTLLQFILHFYYDNYVCTTYDADLSMLWTMFTIGYITV
jgi:hypothetical protein